MPASAYSASMKKPPSDYCAHSKFVHCKGKKIFFKHKNTAVGLDCESENSFISHAHADHAAKMPKAKVLLSSHETLHLMQVRGETKGDACSHQSHSTCIKTDDAEISILNAGHVLGSSMLFAQTGEGSFLYTADFKTKDSILTQKAVAKQCDELLIEATYGHPDYKFPSREQVYTQMAAWTLEQKAKGKIALFGGYSLGKAQEIIKVLNQHCQTTPVVPTAIANICEVYNKFGAKLDYIHSQSPEAQALLTQNKQFTAVLPHHQVNSALAHTLASQYKRQVATAVATGWATGRLFDANTAFILSDHCDYKDLLEFIEQTQAKTIITTHGYCRELAQSLRDTLGKTAFSLKEKQEQKNTLLAHM